MLPWPPDTARSVLNEVDSTNSEAERRAQAGDTGPGWILALHQSAGRGRRGRPWKGMHAGNFAASYLFEPKLGKANWAQASFAAALALHDVISALAPRTECRLKWPNDVLVAGAKISGILLETSARALIIGIGVNLTGKPPDEAGATALSDHIRDVPSPAAFLDLLGPALHHHLTALEAGDFAQLRADWLSRAMGIGTTITARLPGVEHVGVFEGIDESGALILRTPSQRLVLAAGDVYFGRT